MQKINRIIAGQSKLQRFRGPLRAAQICAVGASQARGRYEIISFNKGLLTLKVASSAEAASLQPETQKIIDELNKEIGENVVNRVRFKIS